VSKIHQNSLEEKTLEAHNFLKNIGEWLATFGKAHSQLSKTLEIQQHECTLARQNIDRLEKNIQRIGSDGNEAREKEIFMATELELVQG